LKRHDFGVLHVEAPDEASHSGQWRLKVKAITDFDQRVVGPAVSALRTEFPESRVMVMADHITSLRTRTHTPDPIPFLISGTGVVGRGAATFSEKTAGAGRRYLREGWRLMEFFLRPEIT